MKDAWIKLKDLQEHPELANTPGYELEILEKEGDPIDWFLLLIKHPQFAPSPEWWYKKTYDRSNLPWAKLLAAQPQFENYCYWESVSRWNLVELAFLAPEIFKRKFPQGRWHDLYAFLTDVELMILLSDVPQIVEHLDMEEVKERLDPDLWLTILSHQPQLEKYFDWARAEGKICHSWDWLLRRQPQFAKYCDWSKLGSSVIRRILVKQPQLITYCDWSKINEEDRKILEGKGIKP